MSNFWGAVHIVALVARPPKTGGQYRVDTSVYPYDCSHTKVIPKTKPAWC